MFFLKDAELAFHFLLVIFYDLFVFFTLIRLNLFPKEILKLSISDNLKIEMYVV